MKLYEIQITVKVKSGEGKKEIFALVTGEDEVEAMQTMFNNYEPAEEIGNLQIRQCRKYEYVNAPHIIVT